MNQSESTLVFKDNVYEYAITVQYGNWEGCLCYKGSCNDFSNLDRNLDSFADTPEEAYALVIDGIQTTKEIFTCQ